MNQEIISSFRQKPKTTTAWWALWLGLSTICIFPLLGISAAFFVPLISRISNEKIASIFGFIFGILSLSLSVAALVTGIKAFKIGERSWVMWIGFVPALLIGAFWIFMIIGELVIPH